MSLFFWKKNKNIDTSASNVANEFYSYISPSSVKKYFESSPDKSKQDKKLRKAVETQLLTLVNQIHQQRITLDLGTYGKARFQLKFNERLKELGYDSVTVSKLSEYILISAR
jgi:hypothetical protein